MTMSDRDQMIVDSSRVRLNTEDILGLLVDVENRLVEQSHGPDHRKLLREMAAVRIARSVLDSLYRELVGFD